MPALVDLDVRPHSFIPWPVDTEQQLLFAARASARRRFKVDVFKTHATGIFSNQSFNDKEVRNARAK